MVRALAFAIFKDSNSARTQFQIRLGTTISIARNYENNHTTIQIAGCRYRKDTEHLYFRKDAPGMGGGLGDDSMSFNKSSLLDLTSSLVVV